MDPIQQIYWHSTVKMPDDSNPSPLPPRVDVAVIGGGITGLSAARALARRGVSVAVLEANAIGWGASSRNGGMVLTGLKLPMETVFKRYGREAARSLFRCSLDAIATVERVVGEEKIECGFQRWGHLVAANKPRHFAALSRTAEFMEKEFGHKLQLIPRSVQCEEIGTDLYHGASIDEVSGGLNPAQYVTGLAGAAQRAGASLHPRTRVTHVEHVGSGFRVEIEGGGVSAEKVLVATSGYTGRATPRLQRKIIPVGSFIIATERLSESLLRELSPKNRMIFDYKHYLNYFRLWDNRLIFGGRAAFFPENPNTLRQSARILQRELVGVYPQLRNAKIEYVWGGTLDFAFDMMPHVGEMGGLHYCLGYAGHGVAMASYLGQEAAECMIAGSIQDHPFASFSFPGAPLGLYDGRPWFLPFAGLWQKLLDWIE